MILRIIAMVLLPSILQAQDLPTVGARPFHQAVIEGQSVTVYLWREGGDIHKPIMVRFSVGNNAEPGVDYRPRIGPWGYMTSRQFKANQKSMAIKVQTRKQPFIGRPVFITLRVVEGPGYRLGSVTDANVGIWTPAQYLRQCQLGFATQGC